MSNLITISQKHTILKEMPELEMHKKMKALFEKIYPDKQVYIGQGSGEFGKDLVLIEKDPLSGEKVTAFVVKMGDLKGNADSGIIGTINTQINQAFNVPTYFKEIGREVKADSVIVAIFGSISNNLDQTLKGYLTGYANYSIQVKKIEELTSLFEEYYDDVFHISSEIEDLEKKHQEIESLLVEKNKYIAECYIEPNLKTFEKTKSEIIVAQSTGELSDSTLKDTMFGKKETIPSLIKMLNKKKKFVLVEGEAGAGKSIFSMKIIQNAIEETIKLINTSKKDTQEDVYVPVLIKSTKIKNVGQEEFSNLIKEYYNETYTILKTNIVVIDGLDEVNNKERKNIIKIAEKYCNDNNTSLIFTTRKDQDISNQLKSYNKFELLAFELSQAIEFLKKMASKNENLINSLLENLHELQHQIPMTPMSLALLVEVSQKYNEIPASITELYNRYINMVIGVDNKDSDISQLFEPRYKLDFLVSISYELFYKHNDSSVSKEKFDEYLEQYVLRHTHISSKDDFLKDLKRVTILYFNDTTVSFSHKSFLDYLIARYFEKNTETLINEDKFNDLYSLYYTALWEDVTNFYFGLKDTITEAQLKLILSKNPYKDKDDLMFNLELYSLGRLLQYAWNTDKEIKKKGISLASENILQLRECIDTFNKESFGLSLPKIVADASLMQYTDTNYSSVFLRNEIIEMITETIAYIQTDDCCKEDISNRIYFLSGYILINNNKLETADIENFIQLLIDSQKYVDIKIYFPITFLFKLFTANKKINISQDKIDSLEKIFRTIKRKYSDVFNDTLLFKNKIDARKFKNIHK